MGIRERKSGLCVGIMPSMQYGEELSLGERLMGLWLAEDDTFGVLAFRRIYGLDTNFELSTDTFVAFTCDMVTRLHGL